MAETLYIVENNVLVGTVTKTDADKFLCDFSDKFPENSMGLRGEALLDRPPAFLAAKVYSPNRPDIEELLEQLGLDVYDVWEMAKKTLGKSHTDSILAFPEGNPALQYVKGMLVQKIRTMSEEDFRKLKLTTGAAARFAELRAGAVSGEDSLNVEALIRHGIGVKFTQSSCEKLQRPHRVQINSSSSFPLTAIAQRLRGNE